MTNKELQKLLKNHPDEMVVVTCDVEGVNRELQYGCVKKTNVNFSGFSGQDCISIV